MVRSLVFAAAAALVFASAPAHADALKFDSNVPQDIVTKVTADLQLVTGIQASGKSPLHAQVYGNVDGANYMIWFGQRILAFGYDGSGTTGAAVAYNPTATQDPEAANYMMVTDYFVKGNQPQLARILVLFHEARHSEADSDYWMHINCPNPYNDEKGNPLKSILSGVELAGQPACDTTYLGAYGASTIMINDIGRFCTNCSEKIKNDADLYSADQVYRLVNDSDRATLRSDFRATAP